MNDFPAVTILTSAVGLGVYIPALLTWKQLTRLQCSAEVEVVENYYVSERKRGHLDHKRAHHENFALAQMAHRMTRDIQECLDRERIEILIDRWLKDRRENFIVWSGFWLPIIERYRQLVPGMRLHVDHCRIDAEISASFKIHSNLQQKGSPIWLWNWEEKRIVHEISVTDAASIAFGDREPRLVVHGGGWGIGSYHIKATELERTPYSLDIVVHGRAEVKRTRGCDRFFMADPDWYPWIRNSEGEPGFPPIGEVVDCREVKYEQNSDFHELHNVIRQSQAIVSKPGGCTLIDSLSSATPVVFLEPYGYAEASNAKIWEYLGFGISYPAWQQTGYDPAVLEKLHYNILSRTLSGADYPRLYAERLLQAAIR